MAPEPFETGACDFFLEKCEQSKYQNKPIKEVIMDGQVISGCGNIYATEALLKWAYILLEIQIALVKKEKLNCLRRFERFYRKVLKWVAQQFQTTAI